MNIDRLINYTVENGSNPNMEFEILFGRYGRMSSNIKQSDFINVLKLSHGKITYKFIY
jgi:hypothetical protein